MELSFTDVLTNEMKDVMSTLKTETREMFKNTKPFRQVKVTDTERIADYLSTPTEVQDKLRQDFGEGYDNYVNNMEQLITKFKGVE
jgi:hypothetical protein